MKLCVALDSREKSKNLSIAKELKEYDLWLKVGFRSFIRDGKALLEELKSINSNFSIFLDLKLYDIPNTMVDSAGEICDLGVVDMFNIHASSGIDAMRMVASSIDSYTNRPILLAVTALTSFCDESFVPIYGDSITNRAEQFAKSAFSAKVDGVVCSAFESMMIKESTSSSFLTLSPGIRPHTIKNDDQQRVANIAVAKDNLVDFAVVGRPIYMAKEPKEVVEEILKEL
jgi:orotidine-5'-phosphate decarboxylase